MILLLKYKILWSSTWLSWMYFSWTWKNVYLPFLRKKDLCVCACIKLSLLIMLLKFSISLPIFLLDVRFWIRYIRFLTIVLFVIKAFHSDFLLSFICIWCVWYIILWWLKNLQIVCYIFLISDIKLKILISFLTCSCSFSFL